MVFMDDEDRLCNADPADCLLMADFARGSHSSLRRTLERWG